MILNMELFRKYQTLLVTKADLSARESSEAFSILRSATDKNAILPFLDAWAQKGVTATELVSCAQILRDDCVKVKPKTQKFIDIVGTGGSSAKIFNVSTASAFVAAGAGAVVAKHGNRAASSKTGSADVLSHLGIDIASKKEIVERCIDKIGICFMFAPKFHNLTKELAEARKTLGKPTIFNLLGPIANPANSPFQLIGIWNRKFMKPLAEAIVQLGTKKTWVVHGEDGLDEITLNGETFVAEIKDGTVDYFKISPEDFGLKRKPLQGFGKLSPNQSAYIVKRVLSGKETNQPASDIVLANAAAAIFTSGKCDSLKLSRKLAEDSIRSGAALNKLRLLLEETNND